MSAGILVTQIQHQSKQAMFEHLAALKSLDAKDKETSKSADHDRKNDTVLTLIDYLNALDGRINIVKKTNADDVDANAATGKITYEAYPFSYEADLDNIGLNKFDAYA